MRGAPGGPPNHAAHSLPVPSPTPGRWRPSGGDSRRSAPWQARATKEVPASDEPSPSRPGQRTWTRWPPCSLRALSRTGLRAGSRGWNRCGARLHSSILRAGGTLQSAVHFLFQRQRERVLAEGPRGTACASGGPAGEWQASAPPGSGPGPRPPPAGSGTHLPAPPRAPGSPGWAAAGTWPSSPPVQPHLPPPPPRSKESPPGRYEEPSLSEREEAATMQIWEVSSHIPADPQQGASGWEITCPVPR